MHLPNHLAIGWIVGHEEDERRSRLLVAWAGVAPDLDALTVLFGQDVYGRWHHVLCHGLVFSLVVTFAVYLLARSWRVAALAILSFHMHLACDLLGSGVEWSISYFYPFSRWELSFPWGWELASWQNTAIMVGLLLAMVWTAKRYGRTFAETFLPARIDKLVSETIVRRFGRR
ncbi:MAG: metal-dependent hydrolase [Deltaproteobacteria bacterium]|nr:metal-dependent hydrolase [Deltaproteobacteria bacterium]